MNIRKTILTAGFVAAALSLSVGASATTVTGNAGAVAIEITDLDINTKQGRQVLHARIKRAAKQVCGSQNPRTAGSLENARKNKACFNDALATTVSAVDRQYLTAQINH